jgi:pyruvate kinase
MCESEKTANEMALCWGVTPFVMPFDFINPQNTIETALKNLAEQGRLQPGARVVIIGAISVGTEIVDAAQMRTV